jgi:DNA-binding PadR family transcriptional regulator
MPGEHPGRGFGPGFGPPGFGPWPGGAGWGAFLGSVFGRARARRGNVRSAILTLLADQPMNGYQIMQAIELRSHGAWKPSSGSIYPTLQQLEDEGLVETEDVKPEARVGSTGSKTFTLSAKGKRYVNEHRAELEADWTPADERDPDPRHEMMNLFRQVATAAMQVVQSGTAVQLDEAKRLLAETRRSLYRILADLADDDDPGREPGA